MPGFQLFLHCSQAKTILLASFFHYFNQNLKKQWRQKGLQVASSSIGLIFDVLGIAVAQIVKYASLNTLSTCLFKSQTTNEVV